MLWLCAPALALSLDEAWTLAERNGEEASMLLEQQKQAGLIRTQAWAALSPKLSVGGNFTLNERETALDFSKSFPPEVLDLIEAATGSPPSFGEPTVINKKSYFDANITVVQPLFSGKAVPGLIGANALVSASEAQYDAGLAGLRYGVASAYWGTVLAQEAEKLSVESVALSKRHADTARRLVEAGNATPQAVLQADIAVARAERDLLGATARRSKAELALRQLVERIELGTLERPEPRAVTYESVDAAMERALARRPDLIAATRQLEAARAGQTASVLGWLPNVDGRFTEAWTENTGFSGEENTWILGVSASWTLWDGGFRVADNAKTASQLRQAEAAAEKAREDAMVEVQGAWEEHARAKAAHATAERELALANENLRLAEAAFQAGASTVLDLDTARVSRDAARLTVLGESMNRDLAALALLKAAGDL